VLVRVHVGVRGRMVGGYATRSGYRLYHYTTACYSRHTGCPIFAARVLPNHAGKTIRIVLQRGTRSGWRTLGRTSVRLNRHSQMAIGFLYNTPTIRGVRLRVSATFPGDADHLSWTSKWKQFKVTR
jgi:hypothetical protein